MLTVTHLRKEFATAAGPLVVLSDVSFDLSPGESLAVVGPSGSGKSTLLHILGSLERPTSGSVALDDVDVPSLDGNALCEYRSRKVGFVFQDHHLLPQLTAAENVSLAMLAAGAIGADPAPAWGLLEKVGLKDRIHSLPAKLSGGERQRVAIARVLVNNPALVLADEPTGNLDRETAEPVAQLFLDLARDRKAMLVVVTHNEELAKRFDKVMELKGGVLRSR